eukprot:5366509-Alexandrium_andersonii.AAC.1
MVVEPASACIPPGLRAPRPRVARSPSVDRCASDQLRFVLAACSQQAGLPWLVAVQCDRRA